MQKQEMTRRRFLVMTGSAGAIAALGLAGCSPSASAEEAEEMESTEEAAPVEEAEASVAEEVHYSDPLGVNVPVPELEDAVWKIDYPNDDLPDDYMHDNWRMAIDPFSEEKIADLESLGLNTDVSNAGMDTLQTIGGADFTENQFDWILAKANEEAGVVPEKLTVMDLRGETHGLIDGSVFMYWIPLNFVNEGYPTEEVLKIEADLLEGLKSQGKVEMYKTDDNWSAAVEEPMVEFDSPTIMTEEELVVSRGAKYVRFASTNHFRPDDHEVDLFVDFMRQLPEDEWIYMHCYAGEGRTTCFMVMADIFKNYGVASFDDISARQGLIGPVDVRTEVALTNKTHYKKKSSIERRVFLQQFYLFAQETAFNGPTWTEWARDRALTLDYYYPL